MKKTICLLLIVCFICTSICACGDSNTSESVSATNSTTTSAEINTEDSTTEDTISDESIETAEEAKFLEQDKVLVDNDMIKVTLNDEVEESYYVGYNVTIENKSDYYILVSMDNTSVDGFMTYISLQNNTLAPEKKAKTNMQIYTDNSDVKTLDDLKNIEGTFTVSTNNDGSSSYRGTDITYPFSIDGRLGSNGSPSMNTDDNPVLVENDFIRVTLGDKVQDSNYVGYQITIENKSDYYVLVSLRDTSVDGFMTYLNLEKNTISPHKIAKTIMMAYTSNSDIKTLDDLKNVEGIFTVSTNTDGINSYAGTSDQWPFTISEDDVDDNSQTNNASSSDLTVSAEEIDAMLQGTWMLGENAFSFDNGSISIIGGGNSLSGTYKVNTAEFTIDADMNATDGTISINIPYEVNNGTLTIKNNQGQTLIKQ